MIIKIFNGIQKRVEDISDTINIEIRNSIVQIKGSINKKHAWWHAQEAGRSKGRN